MSFHYHYCALSYHDSASRYDSGVAQTQTPVTRQNYLEFVEEVARQVNADKVVLISLTVIGEEQDSE